MNGVPTTGHSAESVEQILRAELARGDAAIADARPVLRYLLTHEGYPWFSEAMVANVRGMMLDLASQLLHAETELGERIDRARSICETQDELAKALIEDDALLAHVLAVVVEANVCERLQARSGIDPVLPPLVQELAADDDESTAALAMALLAAQARFMQSCRRMELPLCELPGDLFHAALMALHARSGVLAEAAERRLREGYDEGASRIGLAARAVMALGMRAGRALSIDHAGVGLFASALAMSSGQERDRVVLSLVEGKLARLALTLRAAGLDHRTVGAQLLVLHPDRAPPGELEQMPVDRATTLLTSTDIEAAAI